MVHHELLPTWHVVPLFTVGVGTVALAVGTIPGKPEQDEETFHTTVEQDITE